MSEPQHINWSDTLENFRSIASAKDNPDTRTRYLNTIARFEAALDITPGLPLEDLLRHWILNQWLTGTPLKTAILNLDIISGLYGVMAKDGILPKAKAFSDLKTDLKAIGEDWDKGIDDEIFTRALRLTKNAGYCLNDDAIAADIVLYSLTHGCIPLIEVARLTRADIPADQSPLIEDTTSLIISRQQDGSRRKYIFPLDQSSLTPRQLSLRVNKIVTDLFRRCRLPLSDNIFDTVRSLWAYAALRIGISPAHILARLGSAPVGLPILRLFRPERDPFASKAVKEEEIAEVFITNPRRWYAMNMRPGVRFSQLEKRLEILADQLPPVTLFYPCEEIVKVIRKKIVYRKKPYISQVVFFRAKATDIIRIFSRIGDLAWCYTVNGRIGSPYAEISQRQFDRFQQTIDSFTPDYEVAETGQLQLKKNDRVQIVGGLFAGHEATFDSVREADPEAPQRASQRTPQPPKGGAQESAASPPSGGRGANTIYRLNLIGENGIEWRINLDPRVVTPM